MAGSQTYRALEVIGRVLALTPSETQSQGKALGKVTRAVP